MQRDIMSPMERYPARMTVEKVAERLGFQKHDIPVLVRKKLLVPLGNPEPQCTKYFAAIDIEGKATNIKWLSKATRTIYMHWQGHHGNAAEEDPGESK